MIKFLNINFWNTFVMINKKLNGIINFLLDYSVEFEITLVVDGNQIVLNKELNLDDLGFVSEVKISDNKDSPPPSVTAIPNATRTNLKNKIKKMKG